MSFRKTLNYLAQVNLKDSPSGKAEYLIAAIHQKDALRQQSAAESFCLRQGEVTQIIIAQLAICGLIHILGSERA